MPEFALPRAIRSPTTKAAPIVSFPWREMTVICSAISARTPSGRNPERTDKCLPIVLASANSPYSETIAAIPGKTASSAKNATPPEVNRIRFSEIDQNTRQRISLHPRGGICSGVFAPRPRPDSLARARSTGLADALLAPTSARQSSPLSAAFAAGARSLSTGKTFGISQTGDQPKLALIVPAAARGNRHPDQIRQRAPH